MTSFLKIDAQSVSVKVDVLIWHKGSDQVIGSAINTFTYNYSDAVCNQAAPVVGGEIDNPTKLYVNDPINNGRFCIFATAQVANDLNSLPFEDGMFGTLFNVDATEVRSKASATSAGFNHRRVIVLPNTPNAPIFVQ